MPSPVSLRLDEKTRLRIARIARRNRVSASEVMRQALQSWAEQQEKLQSPYELVADLIGVGHGGNPHRSSQTGRKFAELLKARRRRP